MKKTKLALALAAALPFAAQAAVLTTVGGATTYDDEFLLLANETVDNVDFTWTAGKAHPVGSLVTFTFSEAPIRSETGLAFPFPSTVAGVAVGGGAAAGGLALISQTGTTAVYQVTTAALAISDAFAIVDNADADKPDFSTAGLVAGEDVTVTSASTTSGGVSLADNSAAALVLVQSQDARYTPAITAGVETIDVQTATPKTTFVGGGTTATLTATITSDAAADHTVAAANETITLSGDFSWLDRDAAIDGVQLTAASVVVTQVGGAGAGVKAATVTDTTTAAGLAAVTGGTITISFAHAGDAASYRVDLVGAGHIIIPRQTVTASYSVASAVPTTLASASGSDVYGINGSTVSVYAVPISSGVQNFIYLDNASASSGAVSVSVIDAGTTYGPYTLGTVGPNELFDVGGRFLGAVYGAGETLSGGRVRLDIVTEVASTDVSVSASYKVNSANDRLNLLTSSIQDVIETINANNP
jgi:hypothetical protein